MEDSARLKLIVLGLVLAAIAGAYLFFSGRFAGNKTNNAKASPNPTANASVIAQNNQPPLVILPPNAPLQSDANPLPQTGTKGGQSVESLPNTGLPMDLVGTLGAAAVVIGYALRKFPK